MSIFRGVYSCLLKDQIAVAISTIPTAVTTSAESKMPMVWPNTVTPGDLTAQEDLADSINTVGDRVNFGEYHKPGGHAGNGEKDTLSPLKLTSPGSDDNISVRRNKKEGC
ncbi:MAG: hypothetical protein WC369_08100 [Dehalococcoidales bacterium]